MKVLQIIHVRAKNRARTTWINSEGITLADPKPLLRVGTIETEIDALLDGSVEGVLITCVEMTDADLDKFESR